MSYQVRITLILSSGHKWPQEMDNVILVPRAVILLASTTDRAVNYTQAQKFESIMVTVEAIVLAAFWSQPELLIYDADHNNHISGKENWIACEW